MAKLEIREVDHLVEVETHKLAQIKAGTNMWKKYIELCQMQIEEEAEIIRVDYVS
jgi:hypothetical protein